MIRTPRASYSIIIRLEILYPNQGCLEKLPQPSANRRGYRGNDIAGFKRIVLSAYHCECCRYRDGANGGGRLKQVKRINVLNVTDRTYMIHQGGKIEIKQNSPDTREDLSMPTPRGWRGCAWRSMRIVRRPMTWPSKEYVAVVTDGQRLLGLGDIGPRRRCGDGRQAMLFKEFEGSMLFPFV